MKVYILDPRQEYGRRLVDLNRRKANKEYCLNCSGFELLSRKNCEYDDFPLYPYRIGDLKQNSKARNRAIRVHCKDICMGRKG